MAEATSEVAEKEIDWDAIFDVEILECTQKDSESADSASSDNDEKSAVEEKLSTNGEHMFSGWLCDVSGRQLNNSVSKSTNKSVRRMHYFDKLISSYSYPPIAYFFDIGGFLYFPLFCRHFKSQVVRMTPHTLMVREVLEKCFLIIQEYFPDNVCHFEESTSADYNHSHMKCHLPAVPD